MTRNLGVARYRLRLSVAEVAKMSRVPQGTIRRLERGDVRWVTLAQLWRVARAVGCSLRLEFIDTGRNKLEGK